MIDVNKAKYKRFTNYKKGGFDFTCPMCGGTAIDVTTYNLTGRKVPCSLCKGAGGLHI